MRLTVAGGTPWPVESDHEISLLDTIEHDSDRAVALVIAAMIEGKLEKILRDQFVHVPQLQKKIFQSSGPLGSFSAKIDLAALMNIVSTRAHKDLVVMKTIRNIFAHDLSIKDFRSQKVKDLTDKFCLIDAKIVESADKTIEISLNGSTPTLKLPNAALRKRSAREKYLLTAQVFTFKLSFSTLSVRPLPFI